MQFIWLDKKLTSINALRVFSVKTNVKINGQNENNCNGQKKESVMLKCSLSVFFDVFLSCIFLN